MIRSAPLIAGSALLAAGLLAGLPGPSVAGSHVDAPGLIVDGPVNGADLFAFTSPDKPDTVTLIATYNPFNVPTVRPTVADDVEYDINVDPAGTGTPSLTYRWMFKQGSRRYSLQRLRPGREPELLVSSAPVTGAPGAPVAISGGGQTFAGQIKEPFTFNLKGTVGLIFGIPLPNIPIQATGLLNAFAMAVQVPKSELALNGDPGRNPVIGVWATATRPSLSLDPTQPAPKVQVSRMANPFFNEVVTAGNAKETFNRIKPTEDMATKGIGDEVLNPTYPARVFVSSLATIIAPPGPRKDLEELYLTGFTSKLDGPVRDDLNSQLVNADTDPAMFVKCDELRLNMSIPVSTQPSMNGYLDGDRQGWPNGRRPGDEPAGPLLRITAGELIGKDTSKIKDINKNDKPAVPFTRVFPYMAAPILGPGLGA